MNPTLQAKLNSLERVTTMVRPVGTGHIERIVGDESN